MTGAKVKIDGFRLDRPITHPPKIYIGAQGAKMLRLAGEIGDGVITNFITPETVGPMLEHTREGMRAAGKDPASLDVVCRIMCAVDEDENVARTLFRRALTAYVTVPQYNNFFREIGYEKEARDRDRRVEQGRSQESARDDSRRDGRENFRVRPS